jgi:zinc protease
VTFFKTAFLSALFCLGMFVSPLYAAAPVIIESFTLANGMQVVLAENHRVPVVTHMIWYRVGGADDYPGRSGLAHYNEHMMFQGTEQTKGGEFSHTVISHGGHENAFTSRDYTAYYVSIAKEHLPLVMAMEADRMLHLAPTPENFAKERQVIIEERRMTIENQPEALLAEEMQALLYRNHPYHTPLIGWMHEMEALSREDVLAFHRQFYHPANAVLVVAGDITRKELQVLAEQYYGTLPAGEKYIRHWQSEPPQRGPRHTEMRHMNVNEPEFMRYYTAPSVNTEDKSLAIPAYVLAQVLGGGTTSRFYQSLVVKQKIATNVSVDYSGIGVGPGQLEISATPASGVTLPMLEAAIDREINAIRKESMPEEAVARAKILLQGGCHLCA